MASLLRSEGLSRSLAVGRMTRERLVVSKRAARWPASVTSSRCGAVAGDQAAQAQWH